MYMERKSEEAARNSVQLTASFSFIPQRPVFRTETAVRPAQGGDGATSFHGCAVLSRSSRIVSTPP